MNPPPAPSRARSWRGPALVLLAIAGALLLTAGIVYFLPQFWSSDSQPNAGNHSGSDAIAQEVHQFCSACHRYPPPAIFPRDVWKMEVEQGYQLYRESGRNDLNPPPIEVAIQYYQKRAPETVPRLPDEDVRGRPPVAFERKHYPIPHQSGDPAVSNVNLVKLFHPTKLDVLVCDMRDGWVSAFKPYATPPASVVLGRVAHPAHAEVVDLDGDGIKDIVVADLGKFFPTNDKVGKVVLLKGTKGGKFTPITLLEGVGRVADVQVADFNGDGKVDLIVAVFGWRTTGEIIYLENKTTDWSKPKFVPHVVDDRHGAIHVPVADLNGDGKMDFVALISQEHETIVAFLNDGKGHFRKKTIYTADHPAYGSSGIQLVDLNGDGKLDVLYTNGDVMDFGGFRPFHSVQWLENRGKFPFKHHHLTSMYGAHRAVAGDFRGRRTRDGKKVLDIVAVCCLPEDMYGKYPDQLDLDSVIYLEQTAPGKFVRHSLEKKDCHYVSCAAGSLEGDGKIDLVTGYFYIHRKERRNVGLTIWKNVGLSSGKNDLPGR